MARPRVRLISNFAQVEARIAGQIPPAVFRACHAVRNEWEKGLTGTRKGRRYKVPGTGTTGVRGSGTYYTASAAGEAPARRLGDLAKSIRVMPRILPGRAQARVGTDLEYALYLEHGTRHMAPRPSLRPALNRAMPEIEDIFSEGLI